MITFIGDQGRRVGSSYVAPAPTPHPFAAYLDAFPPMRRAKVQAAMDRLMRLDGKTITRWRAMAFLASEGVTIDRVKGRVCHTASGGFWDIANLSATAVDYLETLLSR